MSLISYWCRILESHLNITAATTTTATTIAAATTTTAATTYEYKDV